MAQISQQINELIKQRNDLADNISAKGISATKTEKYNTLIDKVNDIEIVNGEEIVLENTAKYNDVPSSVVSVEYPEQKNLFKTLTTNSSKNVNIISNDTVILGTENQDTYFPFYITKNLVKGQTYTFSCEASSVPDNFDWAFDFRIANILVLEGMILHINKNGKIYATGKATRDILPTEPFMVDDKARPSTIPNEITLTNFQLELGSTATTYEPFKTYDIGVQLQSKNLILLNSVPSVTNNGITYTFNSDGTITANGTFENTSVSSYATITNASTTYKSFLKLPLGKTYTISGSPEVEGVTTEIRYCNLLNGQPLDKANSDNGTPKTFTTATEVSTTGVQISLKSNGTVTTVENLVFKPQIESGSNATSYSKHISDFSSSKLNVSGKNLWFNEGTIELPAQFNHTYTYKIYSDNKTVSLFQSLSGKKISIYYINDMPTIFKSNECIVYYTDKIPPNNYNYVTIGSKGAALPSNNTVRQVELRARSNSSEGDGLSPSISNIQLEISDNPTTYSPYEGATYTANTDGTVSNVKSIYPLTNLISDSNTTMTVSSGTYKQITPSSGKNSFTKAYQPTVDSSIDSNIKPEYIRKGVTILGVTGTYEPTTEES